MIHSLASELAILFPCKWITVRNFVMPAFKKVTVHALMQTSIRGQLNEKSSQNVTAQAL